MKISKRIGAIILALALLVTSVLTGGIMASAEELPEFDTTLDYENLWGSGAWAQWFETVNVKDFYEGNALVSTEAMGYIAYRVQKNSPVYAKIRRWEGYNPVFFASPDGINWTELTMELVNHEGNDYWYYNDGIGAENDYLKIVISEKKLAEGWEAQLKSVSFNANTDEMATFDTNYDYQNNFWGGWSKWLDESNVGHNDTHGIISSSGMDGYFVWKVQKNSPIQATFKQMDGHAPAFYASHDGFEWTKISMEKIDIGGQMYTHYRDSIGVNNKYIKVVFSTKEGASYRSELKTISFNANTEEWITNFDTSLNFQGEWARNNVTVPKAVETSGIGYYGDTQITTGGTDSYVVYRTADNSPAYVRFLRREAHVDGAHPAFYVSPNGTDWTKVAFEILTDGEEGFYYRECIGAGNRYLKVVFNNRAQTAGWAYGLREIKINEFTSDSLDFANNYGNSINKAFENSGVSQGYLTGAIGKDSYVVYKASENSPFMAKFKWQDSSAAPSFYVSKDGFEWTEHAVKGYYVDHQNDMLYYSDGIGEGNKYFKIYFGNGTSDTWRYDLQKLSYVANTDAKAEMNTSLNFAGEWDLNTYSLPKAVDYSGLSYFADTQITTGGKDSYIVYETYKNSAIYVKFMRREPHIDNAHPAFFVSPNGTDWTQIAVEIETDGESGYYYRESIGKDNKYIKVVYNNNPQTGAWAYGLKTISFNSIDITGDGKVNAEDIVSIRKVLTNQASLSFDFNGDGKSDIKDLVFLKKYLA